MFKITFGSVFQRWQQAPRSGLWLAGLIGCALAITPVTVALAQDGNAAADEPHVLTIAVGNSEPGHVDFMTGLISAFNTRSGVGEVTERPLIALLTVDDGKAAMEAAQSGLADFAFATLASYNVEHGQDDAVWYRPLAVEVLTIVTRRNRLVRDPRQLRGLRVEIAGSRVDRLTREMNTLLEPYGISIADGSFVSSGDMSEDDAFLRLCRSEYDVRVDMVIHPLPAFAGNLPCEVRFLSFVEMDVPETSGPGTMRYVTSADTYSWLRQDFTSLGNAVALIQFDKTKHQAFRDELVNYINLRSQDHPGLLSSFDASFWAGKNPEPTQ
ncbi:MAG: hypothetical protein CL559_06360 [Alphaproteobacteria bacterium]|nr:hypothetical protein [Alphaproteobacteria bacterium]|tara:strand:- start:8112 stop:9089 length:978 start_codon:yes stop_codon:yes gene_type:complete